MNALRVESIESVINSNPLGGFHHPPQMATSLAGLKRSQCCYCTALAPVKCGVELLLEFLPVEFRAFFSVGLF